MIFHINLPPGKQKKQIPYLSRHFWVDDFPLCVRFLEGNPAYPQLKKLRCLVHRDWLNLILILQDHYNYHGDPQHQPTPTNQDQPTPTPAFSANLKRSHFLNSTSCLISIELDHNSWHLLLLLPCGRDCTLEKSNALDDGPVDVHLTHDFVGCLKISIFETSPIQPFWTHLETQPIGHIIIHISSVDCRKS